MESKLESKCTLESKKIGVGGERKLSKSDSKASWSSPDSKDSKETKMESKDDDFGDVEVDVTAIRVCSEEDGSLVPLTNPLSLEIDFKLSRTVEARWNVKLLVDCSSSRVVKLLGQTANKQYSLGTNSMTFHTDGEIDLSGFSKNTLSNAGLIMCCLEIPPSSLGSDAVAIAKEESEGIVVSEDGWREVLSVNLVVNVAKKKGSGGEKSIIMRQILNPFE